MSTLNVHVAGKFPAHQGAIFALHHTPDSNRFFSGSGDGTVAEWNTRSLGETKLVARVASNIYSLSFLDDKNHLLIGQAQGGLHVVDLNEKKEVKHLSLHKSGIFDIQIRNNYVLTAGGDGVLYSLNSSDYSSYFSIKVSTKSLRSIDFHPQKNELAIGCSDHQVYILDSETRSVKRILRQHSNSVFKVKYTPDGKFLLSAGRDAHLAVWEIEEDYSLNHFIPAHNYTINDIVFGKNGTLFATASRDKSLKIWDSQTFTFLNKLDASAGGHINSVNKAIWQDNHLFSCSDDRSVIDWEIKSE